MAKTSRRRAVLPDLMVRRIAPTWTGLPRVWREANIRLGLAWLALILAFASDWAAMAGQWWNSSTYTHILLVPAIVAWLVVQRWGAVEQVTPGASPWGLAPLGLAVLGWVLGSFAGLDLLRQAASVAMLPSTALLLLGPRAFAALLFPLSYLLFLIPFGDELVPNLQTLTARLTIALVRFSGVPAVIDGVFIDTPAGLFEVAEACSGVKFLIAMIALGALVANIGFRHWGRRAAFMALCIVVPVLANGVRAWGTIFAAQYVGIERAAGIDHLIYGWLFFALVIVTVMAMSWRYFDRPRDAAMIDPQAIMASPGLNVFGRARLCSEKALVMAALLVAAGLGWSAMARALVAPIPQQLVLPAVPGWQRTAQFPEAPWEPRASGADHRLIGTYVDRSGQRVDMFFALYAAQAEGREAGGFGQGALVPGGDWSWSRTVPAPAGGKGEVLVYRGTTERVAQTWYRTGDLLSGSNARLKLANIADRAMMRARPTVMLILSAQKGVNHDPEASLAAFHDAIGAIGPWMDRIAQAR